MELPTIPVTEIGGLIGDEWRHRGDHLPLETPLDGQVVAQIYFSSVDEVDEAVRFANSAAVGWWAKPAYERAGYINRLAGLVADRIDDFALQMSIETGRPLDEARGEVKRSASTLRISAEEATRITGEMVPMEAVAGGVGKLGFTLLTPVGVVGAITPFNAPLVTVCHKLGPALAGGNTLILKPHLHGSGVATLLAELIVQAGFPPGVFQLVHGDAEVGRALTTHPNVDFVNFTGSGKVAEAIIASAGLKRTLLELGGNAPTIVHHDANLAEATEQCAAAAFGLAGQSCISTQRIYVHKDIAEPFAQGLVQAAKARSYRSGPGVEGGTGPLLTESDALRVHDWIEEAVGAGSELLCGGGQDYTYVEPTVLSNVPSSARVLCDEVFGPVVSLIEYEDLNEAIRASNDSPWGLKAGVFTNSLDVALTAARALEFGAVNINATSRSRVDQEPSGGIKQSGWGKEGPRYAIREMMNVRMISL